MLASRTYSIKELEKLSGFDRRTIVYYSQQGLLPKAGRRGPNTRHPELCLQRLMFIRGLRDHQDQGRCNTITLQDMGRMIRLLDEDSLRGMLERGLPLAELEPLLQQAGPPAAATPSPAASPADVPATQDRPPARKPVGDGRSYGLADAGIRQRGSAAAAPAAADHHNEDTHPRLPALDQPPGAVAEPIPEELGDLLRELEVRPGMSGRRLPPGASEQWTEIPITSRVFLSVRGLSAEDAPLADATARALKKLLRTR